MILAPNGQPARETIRQADTAKKPRVSNLWEAFEGAKYGGYRGWWFLPTLNAEQQMPQWTREQIARKQVWCYNNIGEARALIDGLAIDEVDTAIWPKAMTSSPAFNKAATNRFHDENSDPRTFDFRETDDVYSAQFTIRRSIRLFGALFGQLVRPTPDFLGRITPRVGFLPDYQCTSDGADAKDFALREGVRFDPNSGAPQKYRFRLPQPDPAQPERYAELEAADVLHFHDPFLPDQIRGISTLAPVTRQMFSMDDIDRAETSGQLLRSRIAYAVETTGPDEVTIPKLPGVTDTEIVENPDGSKTIIQKFIARDGEEVDVFTPPSNMRIKTLESNRGGALDFRNFLARGMCHATIYPPEWCLFIMGLGQGTVARIVQNRVQKIATFFRNNQLAAQFVRRWYTYWLWQRIKVGVFDSVGVPADWYAHRLIFPRDLSVDLGREGRLYDDRVMRGNMSDIDYHGMQGRDHEDVDEELVETAIRRRRMLEERLKREPGLQIRYEEVWRLPAGTANVAAAIDAGADDPALTAGPVKSGGGTSNSRNANGAVSTR